MGLWPQMELELEATALTVRRKKAVDIKEIGTNMIRNDSWRSGFGNIDDDTSKYVEISACC